MNMNTTPMSYYTSNLPGGINLRCCVQPPLDILPTLENFKFCRRDRFRFFAWLQDSNPVSGSLLLVTIKMCLLNYHLKTARNQTVLLGRKQNGWKSNDY